MDADLFARSVSVIRSSSLLVKLAADTAATEALRLKFVSVATSLTSTAEPEPCPELDWCSRWVSRKWKARGQRRLDWQSNVRRRKRRRELERRKRHPAMIATVRMSRDELLEKYPPK